MRGIILGTPWSAVGYRTTPGSYISHDCNYEDVRKQYLLFWKRAYKSHTAAGRWIAGHVYRREEPFKQISSLSFLTMKHYYNFMSCLHSVQKLLCNWRLYVSYYLILHTPPPLPSQEKTEWQDVLEDKDLWEILVLDRSVLFAWML